MPIKRIKEKKGESKKEVKPKVEKKEVKEEKKEEAKIPKKKKRDILEDLKLFNKWPFDVELREPGLMRYINLKPIIIPRTSGVYEAKKFWKSKMNIVERLINKLMTPGHKRKKHWWTSRICTGKAHKAYLIVEKTFDLIHKKTNLNPIEVLVRAIENSAPREEITSIESGGIRHPKSVDVSPQRRVDLSLRWMTQGAYKNTVNKKTSVIDALAKELILASKGEKSFAVSRKIEVERQAAASR